MSTPQRIQLKRTKGWRKPEGVVVVSRPSRWGNPFQLRQGTDYHGQHGQVLRTWAVVRDGSEVYPPVQRRTAAGIAVAMFRNALIAGDLDVTVGYAQDELAGKSLACWCPLDGQPCHADVLLEIANLAAIGETREDQQ